MSDSETHDPVSVSSEGVTASKRFEEEEFPVPAIAFEVASAREESVSVRLSDTVPDSVAVEDLGFHPEYGSEFWTIEEETITFEREFDPEESYTTVYGIRATGADDIERFLTEPTIEEVDPPVPEGADIETAVPDPDPDPGDEDEAEEESVETIELNDPDGEGATAATTAPGAATNGTTTTDTEDTAGGVDVEAAIDPVDVGVDEGTESADDADEDGEGDGPEPGAVAVDGSLAAALAEEIERGEVPEEDVSRLREALELGGSVEARLNSLQDDVADLRAYTDALEEFLDEQGTGEQLIADTRDRVEAFADTVEEMEQRVAETEETASAAEERSEEIDGDLADLSRTVESLEEEVTDLRERMTEGDLDDRLSEIEADLADLDEWQTQIKETFGG